MLAMKSLRLPSALLVLLQTALFARSASALVVTAADLHNFFPRDTCGGKDNLTSCGQGLPSNFCCPTGNTCIPLYNTNVQATAICCPAGNDCTSINIITCDTSYQDPKKYPQLPLHSTDTSQPLPNCGKGCCPLGYECVDDVIECRMKDSTKQPASSSASSSNVNPTTASSSSGTSSMTATSIASSSSNANATSSPLSIEPKKTSDNSTAGLVLAGLFPGLLAGAAITLGILFFLKRRREKRGYKSDTSSSFFGPPTPHENKPPKISEPIYQPGMSDRVVFGHNRTPSGATIPEGTATYNGYYKPSDNRTTTDSATLVSPNAGGGKKVRTLDPPFETPTKPGRTAQRDPAKSFFSRSSSRSSRRNTQRTTGSMETISMLMGPPRVPSYQRTPDMRQTTYSDVYRAAGISPSQVKSTRPSEDTPRYER